MKPLLAAKEPPKEGIKFPVLASPKIDGVRCRIHHGVAMSRSWKPFPNRYIQEYFAHQGMLEGLDGELAVGNPWDKNLMQQTTSGVMSEDGEPNFTFWVFDFYTKPKLPFELRYLDLQNGFASFEKEERPFLSQVKLLPHLLIRNDEEFVAYEAEHVAKGYEGVMYRSLDGIYKEGRSTSREGILVKIKRFKDSEATIVDFKEFMHNANELKRDAYGHAKRSSHQENKIAMNMLGAFECIDNHSQQPVSIGTGFTAAQRQEFWLNRASLIGKTVKYKFFNHGIKEAPRHPVFIGFRDRRDM